jgi:hypothetical protein
MSVISSPAAPRWLSSGRWRCFCCWPRRWLWLWQAWPQVMMKSIVWQRASTSR